MLIRCKRRSAAAVPPAEVGTLPATNTLWMPVLWESFQRRHHTRANERRRLENPISPQGPRHTTLHQAQLSRRARSRRIYVSRLFVTGFPGLCPPTITKEARGVRELNPLFTRNVVPLEQSTLSPFSEIMLQEYTFFLDAKIANRSGSIAQLVINVAPRS